MSADATIPLCVDLDGTLITGDTLRVSIAMLAARRPWLLPVLPFVLMAGRPALKRFIALRVVPDPSSLPWRTEVVDFVREERGRGRPVYLVTAADRRIAEAVSGYLGLFDAAVATDGAENLKGDNKVLAIRKVLQGKQFDYIGDSTSDLPVFAAARCAYLVAPSDALRRSAESVGSIARIFEA